MQSQTGGAGVLSEAGKSFLTGAWHQVRTISGPTNAFVMLGNGSMRGPWEASG